MISKHLQRRMTSSLKTKVQYKLNPSAASKISIAKELDLTPKLLTNKDEQTPFSEIKSKYDNIIIGAGHNGLICANYLAKAGQSVLILEKRHKVGGCAVTEEIVEGYKFSRCAYVLSLFRKIIIDELFQSDFYDNVKIIDRGNYYFSPNKFTNTFMMRYADREQDMQEIARFSQKDAENYPRYEEFLNRMLEVINPLIDIPIFSNFNLFNKTTRKTFSHFFKHRNDIQPFYHLLTSSAEKFLDEYFENEQFKAVLSTDAIIGSMKSPKSDGSAYVLLHHVMGDLEDGKWFVVKGGLGSISQYLANKAMEKEVTIAVNSPVTKIIVGSNQVEGVVVNGKEIKAQRVITNCDMNNTYLKLMDETDRTRVLGDTNLKRVEQMDYTSPVFKINLILDKLPQFKALLKQNPGISRGDYETLGRKLMTGTIHLNSENMDILDQAYQEARQGYPSSKPMIEMTIPSLLDSSLVPQDSGHHVVGLFCQYAPYLPKTGPWNEENKQQFANVIFNNIEQYCEGFTESILYADILSPLDLEKEFSITGGNIFLGSMNLNQIFMVRPVVGMTSYEQFPRLFNCSSAMHPGGGVMGAPGRNCALTILKQF